MIISAGLGLPKTAHIWGIDPGLQGTGYAHLEWNGRNAREPHLTSAGVITVPSALDEARFEDRALYICDRLYELVSLESDSYLVSEYPEYFAGANTSMGWKTGDLQRLTFLVGMICGRVTDRFFTVPVRQWKGQLPKNLVTERVQNRLGKDRCAEVGVRTHAWDAVGIGLWAMGRF